jgi:hypothetical protein
MDFPDEDIKPKELLRSLFTQDRFEPRYGGVPYLGPNEASGKFGGEQDVMKQMEALSHKTGNEKFAALFGEYKNLSGRLQEARRSDAYDIRNETQKAHEISHAERALKQFALEKLNIRPDVFE